MRDVEASIEVMVESAGPPLLPVVEYVRSLPDESTPKHMSIDGQAIAEILTRFELLAFASISIGLNVTVGLVPVATADGNDWIIVNIEILKNTKEIVLNINLLALLILFCCTSINFNFKWLKLQILGRYYKIEL